MNRPKPPPLTQRERERIRRVDDILYQLQESMDRFQQQEVAAARRRENAAAAREEIAAAKRVKKKTNNNGAAVRKKKKTYDPVNQLFGMESIQDINNRRGLPSIFNPEQNAGNMIPVAEPEFPEAEAEVINLVNARRISSNDSLPAGSQRFNTPQARMVEPYYSEL